MSGAGADSQCLKEETGLHSSCGIRVGEEIEEEPL